VNESTDISDYTTKYVFTDGCGNISAEFASLIDEEFGLLKCSAYQIRFKGVKGVLMLKPALKGRLIEIRKSMVKFTSEQSQLEVIRCSTFSQGYLN
jgi:RNA-dependent RNA polymerase